MPPPRLSLSSLLLSLPVAGEKGGRKKRKERKKKKESSGKNDGPLATVVRDQVSLLSPPFRGVPSHVERTVSFLCAALVSLIERWLSFWPSVSFVNVIVSGTR